MLDKWLGRILASPFRSIPSPTDNISGCETDRENKWSGTTVRLKAWHITPGSRSTLASVLAVEEEERKPEGLADKALQNFRK